eukprot:scaffold4017_cov48-Phaeocystis_antarctica.AAC.2
MADGGCRLMWNTGPTKNYAPIRLRRRQRVPGAASRVGQPRPVALVGRGRPAKRAILCAD